MRFLVVTLALCVSAAGARAADSLPGVRTLYLVRHGFYDSQPGADQKTEMGLNALGREQAALVAERLARMPIKFHSITSSEFTRARETGDIIAAKLGLPCSRDGDLNEAMPPGAGTAPEQRDAGAEAQLEAAWRRFTSPNSGGNTHELLVCHGNVIRWFVCRALGADTQRWTRMEIANCSITLLQVQPDGSTRLQQFNEIAHIPLERQTWSGTGPMWPLPANQKK